MYLSGMGGYDFQIRAIRQEDNVFLAGMIRQVLGEFGLCKPGTVATDPTTDNLYVHFQDPGSAYFVAETENTIIGGAGIHQLDGGNDGICELQKMYLLPNARGKGTGSRLMKKCLQFAREQGYEQCYLESMTELKDALHLYEKTGFQYLKGPLGNTGHHACGVWMIKSLL